MTPSLNKFSPSLLASLADFPNPFTFIAASWALNLTLTSQPVTRFPATNIPHLHLLHVTFIFPISLLPHDIVPTFLHHFMHRFPRLLMMHVSCLFYHPRPSLLAASSFLSLSVSLQIGPPLSPDTLGTVISSPYSQALCLVTFSTRIHLH